MSYGYSESEEDSDVEFVSHPTAAAAPSKQRVNSYGNGQQGAANGVKGSATIARNHTLYSDNDSSSIRPPLPPSFPSSPPLPPPLGLGLGVGPSASTSTSTSTSTSNARKVNDGSEARTYLPSKTIHPPSDIIEIDSEDDDEHMTASTSTLVSTSKATATITHTTALRKTGSAPADGRPLFRPPEADDDDNDSDDEDLPDLFVGAATASTSFRSSSTILQRSLSDSAAAALSTTAQAGVAARRTFQYTNASSTFASAATSSKGKQRALSPIPGSSPPQSCAIPRNDLLAARDLLNSNINSKSIAVANQGQGRFELMSDVESSGDEEAQPKRKRPPPPLAKAAVSSTANEASADEPPAAKKIKPLTKKQIGQQEVAERRALKELEKKEKARMAAIEKEHSLGLRNANKLETRQEKCKEIIVDISAPLMEDLVFRDKIWINLDARLTELSAEHPHLGRGTPARSGCFNKLISWRRNVNKDYIPEGKYWKPRQPGTYTQEQEKTVLLYLTAEEVERAVAAHLFKDEDNGDTLLETVSKVRSVYGQDFQVFILVQNLSQKAKSKRATEQAEWAAESRGSNAPAPAKRKKNAKWDDRVSIEAIEQEFTRLEVIARCSVQKNETFDHTVDWIVEFTKDVAFRPYKQIERMRELYLNIDGKIESSDRGDFKKTYVNMLACINGVTEPIAKALAERYPTWQQLLRAQANAPVPKHALQGIGIINKVNGAATNRCIGAALSERIHIVLNSKDPNLLLTGDIKTVRSRV